MNISVFSIDSVQDHKSLGAIEGCAVDYDPDIFDFSKENLFYIDGVKFEISAIIAKSNSKGNLVIKKDEVAYINSLITIDEVFTLAVRVSVEYWLHITISK